eukprot:scaffold281392_cov23-Tisochrysis_lutea.AAC.2
MTVLEESRWGVGNVDQPSEETTETAPGESGGGAWQDEFGTEILPLKRTALFWTSAAGPARRLGNGSSSLLIVSASASRPSGIILTNSSGTRPILPLMSCTCSHPRPILPRAHRMSPSCIESWASDSASKSRSAHTAGAGTTHSSGTSAGPRGLPCAAPSLVRTASAHPSGGVGPPLTRPIRSPRRTGRNRAPFPSNEWLMKPGRSSCLARELSGTKPSSVPLCTRSHPCSAQGERTRRRSPGERESSTGCSASKWASAIA